MTTDAPAAADTLTALDAARDGFAPPRLTLRSIITDLLALDALIDAAEGEVSPDVEAKQAALFDALQDKADGIVDYLRALDTEAAHLKAEEARVAALRKRLESRRDNLKSYVAVQMQRRGLATLTGAEYTGGIRLGNSTSVAVTDETLLPDEYLKVETSSTVDKKALAVALKAGKPVPGAALKTSYFLTLP